MADDPNDAAAMARHARALADAIDGALEDWVVEAVARRAPGLDVAARDAARRCRTELGGEIRRLLETDVDEQRSTPLQLLRGAARYPGEVLAAAGVAPVDRDEFARRQDPTDVYALAPASWRDLGEAVAEAGIVWGAAKAHVHLARRRRGA